MPITTIGSYVTVMDEVAAHWEDVNTELGGTPATDLKLEGAFTRAMFITMRNDVDASITGLEDLENAREIAGASRDGLKGTLRQKMAQFRNMLRAVLPKSKYIKAVPAVPAFGSLESRFLSPFDDMASVWARIDADSTIPGFTPPLVVGSYTRAMFIADLAALRTAYSNWKIAQNDEEIGRRERDALLRPARERMIQYRAAVEAVLGPDHPLTQSLPILFPAPGSTPAAVTLSGSWNPAADAAVLSWTASSDPNLDEYEVRMSPGSSYDADTATVVASLPSGTLTVETTVGLEVLGATASFKVFVKLTTGNESGSNTVTITRP